MATNNNPTAPRITSMDLCDAPIALCHTYNGREALTVRQLDRAMAEAAATKDPEGGYAKFRFTLTVGDDEIGMRVDVDHVQSEGRTLAECLAARARYWRNSINDGPASAEFDTLVADRTALYERTALAALLAAV